MHHKELSYFCTTQIYMLMVKYILYLSLLAFVLFAAYSCNFESKQADVQKNELKDSAKASFNTTIKYAKGFSVENHTTYQRLIVHNPWNRSQELGVYILVDQEHAKEVDLQVGERIITVPISRFAIMSSSNIGYFELLQKLNLIKAVADGNRLYNKILRNGIQQGSVQVLGNSAQINTEELIMCNCGAFIQTAYGAHSSVDQSLIDAGVPLIYNVDWMEKSPLARAEWIKFMGALTGENEKADSIFNTIERNYDALKNLVDTLSYKPDVLIGALYKDVWYMPGGASFKAQFLADAGANYHWANDSTKGSLALSFETVLEQQIDAPIWIEVPFKSKQQLLSSDERYAFLDAFKIGAMYHNLKRSNDTGGNDYWEMGLCRPDEILLDLIRIFHPEYAPDGVLKYYERVDK